MESRLPKLPTLSPSLNIANGAVPTKVVASTSKTNNSTITASDQPPPLVPVSMPNLVKSYSAKRSKVDKESGDSGAKTSKVVNTENFDDDYHFLMSLHPFMGQLNNAKKLKMRLTIQQIIMKELFDENEDAEDVKN